MIGYIKGIVAGIEPDGILVDNNGIGYFIYMPGTAVDRHAAEGIEVKVYTHLHVKEDLMQLFGFFTRDDLEVFRLLIGVNGIGPKGALGILSVLSADDLRFAVLSDDVKSISSAPGIGKKTAQKLILELKDKLKLEDAFEKKLERQETEGGIGTGGGQRAERDAVEALVALGYSNSDALRAVRGLEVTEDMDSEGILKLALRNLI